MGVTAQIVDRSIGRLKLLDVSLIWAALVLWVVTFLLGTLIDSKPYRDGLASFQGGFGAVLSNGAVVIATFTHTNVLILCVLAGLLGALGAKAGLGVDGEPAEQVDMSFPRNSAVLRAFLVYLLVMSGLLILGDDPTTPTQRQYVRLAGFISVLGFIVSYRPALFSGFLHRAAELIDGRKK